MNDNTPTVTIEGELVPAIGDKAEIFFELAGTEVSVATGSVVKVSGKSIELKIESATGEVTKDQLVRIKSDRPQPGAAAPPAPPRAPPPAADSPAVPPETTTAYRSKVQMMATHVFAFDHLPAGPLADDAFASEGLRFKRGKGEPGIHAAEANMLLPWPHRKVLLLGGERVTAFTILLDPPVKRFGLYRVGAANGASTPTWKMTAYNGRGKIIGSAGEQHRSAPGAAPFSIEAAGIVRVELTTDNRHGSGTWATWSSLPVAAFGFER